MTSPDPRSSRLVASLLGLWLVGALLLSASGLLQRVPPPAFAFGLTALALGSIVAVPALRAWARTVALRGLILYHAVRFVGVVFLVMAARGTLAPAWAVPAGWGDIAVAVGALAVAALACPVTTAGRWWAVLGWNVFGLLDILMVLLRGLQLGRADPSLLAPLTRLPLALLPTFIVPLILVTHVLLFWRLACERPGPHVS